MNLQLSDNSIKRNYSKLFEKESDYKHLAQMLMFRFLSEVERITDERNLSRKELAEGVGVTPAYITQLYRGNKPLNMLTLAKFEEFLDFRFDIKAVHKDCLEIDKDAELSWNEAQINKLIERFSRKDGFWIYRNNEIPKFEEETFEVQMTSEESNDSDNPNKAA